METHEIISSGILELYAAGLTSEQESREVEHWIVQHPEVAAELKEIAASIEAFAQSFALAPSVTVRDQVMASINENAKVVQLNTDDISGARVIKKESSFWKMAAAATVMLLIGSIVLNLVTYNKYKQAGQTLSSLRDTLNDAQQKNTDLAQGMSVVQNKFSVPVALNGQDPAPDAAAKIFWMKNTGEVYIDASNLPPAPAGKAYQLWGIVDGKPVSGGMILTTKQGNQFRMQKMNSFGKADAFAVTLEPEKGNVTPTMPIYVMGKM